MAAVELAPRDLSRQVDLIATVRPRLAVRVPSRMTGNLETVEVEEGDAVAAGALLARFDTAELDAEFARARAHTRFARTELDNMERLLETDAVSRIEMDRAQVALEVAEAEQRLWQTRLGFASILAPHAGVITARHVEPGESVQAEDIVFEMAAMDRLVLRPLVSERDVVHISAGESVRLRFDALPALELDGRVARVFPAADPGSRLVPVEVALPESAADQGVRPGFLARIRLNVDRRVDVLAVPAAAIGEDGSVRYVYVISEDHLERREVITGVTRGQWTQIEDGLEVGEVVLASNPIDMRPGERVRIVGWRG